MKPDPPVILAADDDPLSRAFLAETLDRKGYRVICAEDGQQALDLVQRTPVDLLIADLKMPILGGIELLTATKRLHPDTEVIIATAYASVENAVEAVKSGAFDYLTKPFSRERLEILVDRALERRLLRSEAKRLQDELLAQRAAPEIVGRHPKMQEALDLARLAADPDVTVLIRGESGTGKELVARFIHGCSRRRDRPFVKTSCAALPEGLLEAELFGHERGAFTTAYQKRIGRFEKANRGTMFLDEIGDLTPSTQIRLLGVLQDRRIERLGSNESIPIDVKVVAATNRDLERLIEVGQFREDLYYRLNVVPIHLPPLRERIEDIPLLAEHFVRQIAGRCGREAPRLTPECLDLLGSYSWPGNIRELENVLERAVIVSSGDRIRPEDLPPLARRPSPAAGRPAADEVVPLVEAEKKMIQRALDRTRWNRTAAARLLGVDRTTLARKILGYGITRNRTDA